MIAKRAGIWACLAAVLAGVVGCGVGTGKHVQDVRVTVSRDFGAQLVQQATFTSLPKGDTVMRALERKFDVDTRFGGQYVRSIGGIAGGRANGEAVDWFYYVNGIESQVGAGSRKLSSDDRVWWDHHPWRTAMRVPAVVGSFPEPFKSGIEGKRLPVRVDCAEHALRPCQETSKRLQAAKVIHIAKTMVGQASGKDVLRVVVGQWREIRRDPAVRQLERGPAVSGVFARLDSAGQQLDLLDPHGTPLRRLGAGAGLVAAVRFHEQAPTWIVTGTDEQGVEAAAASITEKILANRFAVGIERGQAIGLPVIFPPRPTTTQ